MSSGIEFSRANLTTNIPKRRQVSIGLSQEEIGKLLLENGFEVAVLETRVSASMRGQWTAEGALDFAEASSFGNFLGHLPKDLQVSAREEIKRDLESLIARRRPDDAPRENPARGGRIIAVATKP